MLLPDFCYYTTLLLGYPVVIVPCCYPTLYTTLLNPYIVLLQLSCPVVTLPCCYPALVLAYHVVTIQSYYHDLVLPGLLPCSVVTNIVVILPQCYPTWLFF